MVARRSASSIHSSSALWASVGLSPWWFEAVRSTEKVRGVASEGVLPPLLSRIWNQWLAMVGSLMTASALLVIIDGGGGREDNGEVIGSDGQWMATRSSGLLLEGGGATSTLQVEVRKEIGGAVLALR